MRLRLKRPLYSRPSTWILLFCTAPPTERIIDENCGALHPQTVASFVASQPGRFDVGITFDGDADRALFCDAEGQVVNGDVVLLLSAREMLSRGTLAKSTVVATTMSNMGLELALKRSGIHMVRANVGDKYVLEEMQRIGATLGSEQSGHILLSRRRRDHWRWTAHRACASSRSWFAPACRSPASSAT